MKRFPLLTAAVMLVFASEPGTIWGASRSRLLHESHFGFHHGTTSSAQAIVAAVIFLVWFVGIFLVQLVLVGERLSGTVWPRLLFWKKWDLLNICPMFTFFSRLPGVHYRLMVRDLHEGADLDFTPWRVVVFPMGKAHRFLWNPARRVCFAVEDACRSLLTHLGGQVEQSDLMSYQCLAYNFFRNYCYHLPASPGAMQRQFMLVQQRTVAPTAQPEPLFVSPLFAIDSPDLESDLSARGSVSGLMSRPSRDREVYDAP